MSVKDCSLTRARLRWEDGGVSRDEATLERMLRMSMLLDTYGSLLTEKQKEFMRLHYEQDLSFGEIATEFGVSRQAIHDSVKHAEHTLEALEQKLALVRQTAPNDQRRAIAEQVLDLKQRIQQQGIIYNTEWILRELGGIVDVLLGRNGEAGEGVDRSSQRGELAGNHV